MTHLAPPANAGFSDRLIHGGIAFLVLLFVGFLFFLSNIWVVTAGSMRVEAELKRQLPGLAPLARLDEDELPDEAILYLPPTGMPSLNEEPVEDLPRALEQLLKDAGPRRLIVTVQAHPQTTLKDVTSALEALAKAKIGSVTFVVGSEEEF